ncbi:hypothetical protein ACU4GR_04715 [Methylobacterium oryzae CBMB20]
MIDGLTGASWWQIVVFTLVVTHITIAGVIRSSRTARRRTGPWTWVRSRRTSLRFWMWLTTGMVTRERVAIHRKHRAKRETEDDPSQPRHPRTSRR